MKRRAQVLAAMAAATSLGLLSAPAALGGPPGKWTRVSFDAQPKSSAEAGLERTPDGRLHILYTEDEGATEAVRHRFLSPDAKSLSPPTTLASTNSGLNERVDLVAHPGGGIRAFFSGIFPASPQPGGFSNVMATRTSPDGQSWTLVAAASNNTGASSPVYVAAGIGAGVTPSGTPISIWGDSSGSGAGFHIGVNPAAADVKLTPAVAERDPNVAADAQTGEVVLGWNQLGSGNAPNSLRVTDLGLTGVTDAPKSGAVWLQQRVGLTGRIGAGGVYAAYGSGKNPFDARPALWRVGAPNAKVIKQPRDAEHTTLAAAPGGRLWVVWEGKDRGKRVFATRTNPAATKFGAVVSAKPPKGTTALHRLAAEGSAGPLDVLALVARGPEIAQQHARLLPGLSLAAKPKAVKAGKSVTFKVTDAGAAVGGAKVKLKLGKKTFAKTTAKSGKAKIKVPAKVKKGRYTARAAKPGYANAKIKVRVKK